MITGMTTDATAAQQRRLSRPRDGRMVAGVCQGLGEYFDVDPVIFRVTLAVLAFFGGIGIIAYAAAWLFIPEAGSPTTRLETWLRGQHSPRRRDAAIVIAVLILLSLFLNGFLFAHRYNAYRFNGLVIVVAAVLLVAALVSRSRQREDTATADTGYPGARGWTTPRTSEGAPASAWVPPTVSRRPPSWLGWLTVGATMLAAGVVSVLGVAGALHPQPADVLAVSIAVIGLGLVVGGFVGRAWLLIPLGVLLAVALAVTDALPRNLTWTAGDRTWTPAGTTVSTPYVLGAGHATLDLTQLTPTQPTDVVSRVGAGQLTVLVPRGAGVHIRARTSAGEVLLFGHRHNGTGLDVRDSVAGTVPSTQPYTLDLQVGYGEIEVRHATS